MVKETKNTKKKEDVSKKEKVEKKVVSKKKDNSKKETKKVAKKGLFKRIGGWIKSVFREVSKVKWPSKKEMLKYSIATIVFILFFSLFFYVIELLMALLKSLI